MIILDTNVVSEMMRPVPTQTVEQWSARQPRENVFVSVITEAELRYGVALLSLGKRKSFLATAIADMLDEDFADRILPFDRAAASAFAEIAATRRQVGRPIAQADAQIAAIARSRGAALATRNVPDFEDCGLEIMNPWTVHQL